MLIFQSLMPLFNFSTVENEIIPYNLLHVNTYLENFLLFLLKNIKTNPCSFMTRARECVVQYHHKADETSNQQETRAEGDEGR